MKIVSNDDSTVIKSFFWKDVNIKKLKKSKVLINDFEVDLLKEESVLLFEGKVKDNTNLAKKDEILYIINLLEIVEKDIIEI